MKANFMLAIAAVAAMSSAIAEIPKTAAQATATIQQRGAASFLSELTPDEVDQLYRHFDDGEAEWLPLVPTLAAAADGANAEGLTVSLAFALPKNPKGVLSLLTEKDGVLGVGRVCSMPFIEDTAPAGYQRKAVVVVRKVTEPSLRRMRTLCLQALKQAK